ncbi:ABC transporter permease [Candidatus Woesearchaeota archaeon CG10_big_fil_rev_8_21_14_0_10_30_7]|nr:MAG: ABC transporter permease [Candidatus Woesearchaeota archaeon CG10_big_fil_rev_8_21_14_0_10_30_7]
MISEYFKLAFTNLFNRKLRSWLTMIGIFIGIAAVVALISLGQGLQDYISEEFEKLGSDKIIIQTKTLGPPGSAISKSLILTSKDLRTIENIRGIKWAIGMLLKQGQTRVGDETQIGFVTGIDPDKLNLFEEIQTFKILDGRQLKQGDKYNAVVGYNHMYGDLWKKKLRIGSKIIFEEQEFKIVGVMDKIGNPVDDKLIYINKDLLRELLNIEDEESQIMAKTASNFNPEKVAEEVQRKLRSSRGEKKDQETFRVQTSDQLLETFSSIFAVLQAVLVGIAGISLLVGGIGIMNTMYTSVLERTKEIGIMKAVGAKNRDVLLIMLFESGLLGLTGGAIGVIIGAGLSKSVEYIAAQSLGTGLVRAHLGPELIIGALLFSFLIGTISGLMPARRAANLAPVDALRYE